MKASLTILLLVCFSTFSYSQSKIEYGLTGEGSWFMPHQSNPIFHTRNDFQTKNGFGSGVGIYASRNIWWQFSADIGLAYRYKNMKQHYAVFPAVSGGYIDPGTVRTEGWDKLSLHYIVLPVHLQLLISKNMFICGGIETTWLTNYDAVNEKPEFNWTVGFGSAKHKLNWSVNYIKGFKKQGFGDTPAKADGHYRSSINQNNMLQLSFSYPIWQNR